MLDLCFPPFPPLVLLIILFLDYPPVARKGVVGNDTCYSKAIAACGNGMKWDFAMEVFNGAESHGVMRGPVSSANTPRRGTRLNVYCIWRYCCTVCVTCCVCNVWVTCKPCDTATRYPIDGTGSISTLCSSKTLQHSCKMINFCSGLA